MIINAMKERSEVQFCSQNLQSSFDAIIETDKDECKCGNSRKLARLLGYQKYRNFERLIDNITPFMQKEKGMDLKELIVPIDEMAQPYNSGYRNVWSYHSRCQLSSVTDR